MISPRRHTRLLPTYTLYRADNTAEKERWSVIARIKRDLNNYAELMSEFHKFYHR